MARDVGLEELVREALAEMPGADLAGLADKSAFGGRLWLLRGHMLCAARHDGMLVRPEAAGDDALRRRLLESALAFVTTLPPK